MLELSMLDLEPSSVARVVSEGAVRRVTSIAGHRSLTSNDKDEVIDDGNGCEVSAITRRVETRERTKAGRPHRRRQHVGT